MNNTPAGLMGQMKNAVTPAVSFVPAPLPPEVIKRFPKMKDWQEENERRFKELCMALKLRIKHESVDMGANAPEYDKVANTSGENI